MRKGGSEDLSGKSDEGDLSTLLLQGEDMMSRDSLAIRDWAERHGRRALAQPKIQADAEIVATLAALAVRITGATGFYRGTGSADIPIITFGVVTLVGNDGDTSTFKINVS